MCNLIICDSIIAWFFFFRRFRRDDDGVKVGGHFFFSSISIYFYFFLIFFWFLFWSLIGVLFVPNVWFRFTPFPPFPFSLIGWLFHRIWRFQLWLWRIIWFAGAISWFPPFLLFLFLNSWSLDSPFFCTVLFIDFFVCFCPMCICEQLEWMKGMFIRLRVIPGRNWGRMRCRLI